MSPYYWDNNLIEGEVSTLSLPIPLMSPCKLGETPRNAVLVCGSSDPIPLATPWGLDHDVRRQSHLLKFKATCKAYTPRRP